MASREFDWVRWDGRDSDGRMVANGVYYCKVIARSEGEEERSEIIKLMKCSFHLLMIQD